MIPAKGFCPSTGLFVFKLLFISMCVLQRDGLLYFVASLWSSVMDLFSRLQRMQRRMSTYLIGFVSNVILMFRDKERGLRFKNVKKFVQPMCIQGARWICRID